MNIHYIEGFLETARLQSIAKASEKLLISHPALSKQIRTMEAYYNMQLFHRTSAGVALTDAGKLLYDRLLPVYTELTAIRADLASMNSVTKIHLGTLPSLAAHYMPSIVFQMEHHSIQVNVQIRNTSQELCKLLDQGALDAVIAERPSAIAPQYRSIELFEEPYKVIVYPEHPLAVQASAAISDLAEEPLILNPPDCAIRQKITELLASPGVQPRIKTEVHYGEFILGYVATGAGITVLPRITADSIASPDKLISIPLEDARARRTISLISRSDKVGRLIEPFFKQ